MQNIAKLFKRNLLLTHLTLNSLTRTTNAVEGYFSQLRRTVEGTHIHISEKHAEKYVKESEYRYNRRKKAATMLPELLTTFPSQKP